MRQSRVRIGLMLRLVLGLAGLSAASMAAAPVVMAGPYHIGVFYFPGWKDGDVGLAYPKPWAPIRAFPDRIPLGGAYQEGEPALLERQLGEMQGAGIGFAAFDVLFTNEGVPLLGGVVDTYLKLPPRARHGVGFAIAWANAGQWPHTTAQFDGMVRYWIAHYFGDPDYLRIGGRPQLFIVSSWSLDKDAAAMGSSARALLDRAQQLARAAGLPGIDFVAGDPSQPDQVRLVRSQGYQGITSYGYHDNVAGTPTHSYAEMTQSYAANWAMLADAAPPMRVVLPMTAGWDRRPWGGSADPLHDRSRSSPAGFEAHLAAGRAFIASHARLTDGYGIICCWNEFGEGSYIEPTAGDGGGHLAAVGHVFAR